MKVSARESVTVVELEFAAPIPAGNQALVLTLVREKAGFFDVSEVELVVDRTARTVYADYPYWTVAASAGWRDTPVADDPVGFLGEGWSAKRALEGRVAGALLSTKDTGDTNHVRTLLHLLPEVEKGYRG
jgi:hypothetical protein